MSLLAMKVPFTTAIAWLKTDLQKQKHLADAGIKVDTTLKTGKFTAAEIAQHLADTIKFLEAMIEE